MRCHKPAPIDKQLVLRDPLCFLAFGLGVGFAPAAPGTWGTLMAIPLYLALADSPMAVYSAVVVSLFVLGIPLCSRCAQRLAIDDHPGVVWDEIVGLLITLWGGEFSWTRLAAGFLLFRLFDIVKPWPIGMLDRRVKGGLGIMLDDALAGLFAWALLRLWW